MIATIVGPSSRPARRSICRAKPSPTWRPISAKARSRSSTGTPAPPGQAARRESAADSLTPRSGGVH